MPFASALRQTMTIICSTRMTTRTPAWPSALSSAARSRWFPRTWRRPGFRARTPICSLSTTFREISRSTACSVGGGDPSSPTPRICSAPIPKGACERYRLVTIPVVDLDCGLLTSLARDRAETGPCRIGAMATKNVARRRRRRCLRWAELDGGSAQSVSSVSRGVDGLKATVGKSSFPWGRNFSVSKAHRSGDRALSAGYEMLASGCDALLQKCQLPQLQHLQHSGRLPSHRCRPSRVGWPRLV